MFAVLCCQGGDGQVGGGGGGDDHSVELNLIQCLFKGIKRILDPEIRGSFLANGFHRVHEGNDLPLSDVAGDCVGVVPAHPSRADHTNPNLFFHI